MTAQQQLRALRDALASGDGHAAINQATMLITTATDRPEDGDPVFWLDVCATARRGVPIGAPASPLKSSLDILWDMAHKAVMLSMVDYE